MTDPTSQSTDDRPRMPRWVKLFLVVAGIVVLLIVAMMLFGGGEHGPGRHHMGSTHPSTELRG